MKKEKTVNHTEREGDSVGRRQWRSHRGRELQVKMQRKREGVNGLQLRIQQHNNAKTKEAKGH